MEGFMGKRSYLVPALLFGLGSVAACAANEPAEKQGKVVGDWGDERQYPELGGAFASLTELVGECEYDAKTGAMTLTVEDDAQTVVVGKRSVDSVIVVNGVAVCGVTATSKTLKTLSISVDGSDDAAQSLVLDFLNGTFAVGAKNKPGITVDLAGGNDVLAIRGSSGKDAFAVGVDGFATNADTFLDVDFSNVETLSVSLASGDDTFTGQGGFGTGAVFASALTVYGGAGLDRLTGGDVADSLFGGDGNDTLWGAAGADKVNGEGGNDTIQNGADADGADIMNCGEDVGDADVDTVSYALRGDADDGDIEKINVTVGSEWADADGPDSDEADDGESTEDDDVGASCEVVVAGFGKDTLSGDDGANTLYGGPGNDVLKGGDGADVLYGDAGDDLFDDVAYDADGDPVPGDQTGGDVFNGGLGTDTVSYWARSAGVTVTMNGTAADDGEDGEEDNVKADVENIIGGDGEDDITGNDFANVIRGGAGADTLKGGKGNDTFDETAYDTDGTTVLDDTATDADTFSGGDGVDTVDYSARSEDLEVSMTGTSAAADDDDGQASEGDDVYTDVENVKGGTGGDELTGNDGNNTIEGGDGDDTLAGGAGADDLFGGDGDDAIDGGEGDDTIDGGGDQADNFLTCGAGDDIAFNGTVDPDADPVDTTCELLLP
jgi:Ca2+-binding RTX toxin-like protein